MTVGHLSPQSPGSATPFDASNVPFFSNQRRHAKLRAYGIVWALLLAFLYWGTPCLHGQSANLADSFAQGSIASRETQTAVQCELRVVWGGDVQRTYSGSLSIANGTLKLVRNLSLQQDAIGTMDNAGMDRIEIRPHSPTTFGGADLSVRGRTDSLLNLRIDDPLGGKPREFQVPLGDLLEGEWLQTLDERGNRLAIGRQMLDRLRITSDREQRIFAPSQMWRMKISGHRTGMSAGSATAELRFISSEGQQVGPSHTQSVTLDEFGNFPLTELEIAVPAQEAGYDLELSLHRRHMLDGLVATSAALVRRLDVVVFDALAKPPAIMGWKGLATIDPLRASKPGSLAWLASMEVLPTLGLNGLGVPEKLQPYNPLSGAMNQPISHGVLGQRPVVRVDATTGAVTNGACLSLAPQAWLALPLQGLQDNVPHRLRIRVPTDQPIELAISLQQTNALREFPPLSLDSGIVVRPRQAALSTTDNNLPGNSLATRSVSFPAIAKLANMEVKPNARLEPSPFTSGDSESGAAATGDIETQSQPVISTTPYTEHEIVFWPRGKQAYILLANMHQERDASVCDILLECADLSVWTTGESGSEQTTSQVPTVEKRMVGINLDKPLLADCVSARREVDQSTSRALETWGTWEQSIARICQMMKLRDANTLMVKGFSEGGAIFPIERMSPNHRYDSGTFFSDGRSPDIKDAIELMLQHFDRDGLHLILALDLNTRLPSLGRFENVAGQESLVQQPLAIDDPTPLGRSPRYNPLNGRVQEEILAVLRDIVTRYQHHPSFAGIALQLDDQSQLVFAGDRWGYDSETLAEFEKATQVRLPPREQLEKAFSGAARLTFLEWRAGELTKFYARLGDVVKGDRASRKLYLNALRLWDVFPNKTQFSNPNEIIRNPREYMLAFGISPEQLAESPQVELMRGSLEAISNSVNAQDWILRESGQRGLVEFFAGPDTAAVVLRYPRRFEVAATEKLDRSTSRWIFPTLSHPGPHARKKLINQIFHSDPLLLVDGGWLPFSGQEAEVGGLLRTLSELPPIKLQSLALREPDTNLRVRQGQYLGKSYLQIVNNASWTENLKLGYQTVGRNAPVRVLGDHPVALAASGETNQWSLQLAPYEMIGIEVGDPHLTLVSLQHAPNSETTPRIELELAELESLVSQSADLSQQPILANIAGDFENWDEQGRPTGWNISTLPRVTIGQSQDLPHTGGSSLLLENDSKSPVAAWVQSRAIVPPRTGRLAVQAWFRAPAVGDPLLVRLAVVGRTHSGQRFERSMELGGRADNSAIAIDWGRKPATLYVGDVSSESVAELSVLIELVGPGKVWVDDVQVFESFLQPDERNHLRGELLVAQKKLGEKNLYAAERLLDSHWGQYLFRIRSAKEAIHQVPRWTTANQTAALSIAQEGVGESDPNQAASTENLTPQASGKNRGAWSQSPSVFRQMRESLRERWQR